MKMMQTILDDISSKGSKFFKWTVKLEIGAMTTFLVLCVFRTICEDAKVKALIDASIPVVTIMSIIISCIFMLRYAFSNTLTNEEQTDNVINFVVFVNILEVLSMFISLSI